MAASVVDYRFIARPLNSLSPRGMALLLAALALLSLSIALAFAVAGTWLVFPFAGLELATLAAALLLVRRHAHDYDSITLAGDTLTIEQKNSTSITRAVFHRYWAQIAVGRSATGIPRVYLRSHGNEVEVGRFMNGEQCLALARQLQQRTGPHSNLEFQGSEYGIACAE